MKNKGFTLVELLAVVGILAILLAILIPAIWHVSDLNTHPQQNVQRHQTYPMPVAPNPYTPETIKVEPLETATVSTPTPAPLPSPVSTCNCACCKK